MKTLQLLRLTFISFFLFFLTDVIHGQSVYYPDKDNWERKIPAEMGFNTENLQEAVDFALASEYSGDRDLRVAILRSFGYEPGMEIVGPTKKRGGPAGIILKDGYIISEWGDIDRENV